jgi:hypothetical protein
MTTKKKKTKRELYWTWIDDDPDDEGPAGPYSTVEEILAEVAQSSDLHLHSTPVRPGGPLVAKILVGKVEQHALDPKKITQGMVDRVVGFLCEDIEDHECEGFEMSGTERQQVQNVKQLQGLLKTWCGANLISTRPTLINPEMHVVPFNPMQYRTLKLKLRLADLDLSQPVMPEVQPALDALKKTLASYTPKP